PAPPIGNVGHPDLCQVLVVAGDITSHQVADFWGGSERRRLAQLPPYDVQVEDALPVEIALEIGDRLSRSPVACALDAEVAGSLGANRHPAFGHGEEVGLGSGVAQPDPRPRQVNIQPGPT